MFRIGYAQEIFTPPTQVGLQGYFNLRPNEGMYDDVYVKVVIIESNGVSFGFMTYDLASIGQLMFDHLKDEITDRFGTDIHDGLIISAIHTHTGPLLPKTPEEYEQADERSRFALKKAEEAGIRALERALMNLQPGELEVGSVYNNPYGFVRRYWMKNGAIVTNPGWRNPDIDKPECDYDRTIGILAVRQGGRIAALICNIANHGDTIGGNLVSADWYGRFAQEIQHELRSSLPVLVIDDASGDINHFDVHQQFNQTCYDEAVRIGRGYARIVLNQLDKLETVKSDAITVQNTQVIIPHRMISDAELAEARHTLDTIPDIKKEGAFESQDLANKVPAALRYFAQRVIDCREKSVPFHNGRITVVRIGSEIAVVSIPGEPFNGIAQAIRAKSPCRYTFIDELAQSVSGYVPMKECFKRGGYEVQPGVNTVAPEAADAIVQAAVQCFQK